MKMKSDDDDDDDNDDITSSSSNSALIGSVELARLRAKYEKNLEVQKLSFQSEIEQRQCKRGKAAKVGRRRRSGDDIEAHRNFAKSARTFALPLSPTRTRRHRATRPKTKQFEKEKETLLSGQGGFAAKTRSPVLDDERLSPVVSFPRGRCNIERRIRLEIGYIVALKASVMRFCPPCSRRSFSRPRLNRRRRTR